MTSFYSVLYIIGIGTAISVILFFAMALVLIAFTKASGGKYKKKEKDSEQKEGLRAVGISLNGRTPMYFGGLAALIFAIYWLSGADTSNSVSPDALLRIFLTVAFAALLGWAVYKGNMAVLVWFVIILAVVGFVSLQTFSIWQEKLRTYSTTESSPSDPAATGKARYLPDGGVEFPPFVVGEKPYKLPLLSAYCRNWISGEVREVGSDGPTRNRTYVLLKSKTGKKEVVYLTSYPWGHPQCPKTNGKNKNRL